jgi:hypothetical protein
MSSTTFDVTAKDKLQQFQNSENHQIKNTQQFENHVKS